MHEARVWNLNSRADTLVNRAITPLALAEARAAEKQTVPLRNVCVEAINPLDNNAEERAPR